MAASHAPPTGDMARNPGVCPDWELNQQPFGLQAGTKSTALHARAQSYVLNASMERLQFHVFVTRQPQDNKNVRGSMAVQTSCSGYSSITFEDVKEGRQPVRTVPAQLWL